MPLLAGLLVGLFAGLAEFFAKYLTKKLAFAAAAIATFAALTTALYMGISGILNGLVWAFPGHPGVLTGLWVAVPDVAPTCFSAAVAVDTAVFLYRWNVDNLKLASYIT